jgi:hypothetical protein
MFARQFFSAFRKITACSRVAFGPSTYLDFVRAIQLRNAAARRRFCLSYLGNAIFV